MNIIKCHYLILIKTALISSILLMYGLYSTNYLEDYFKDLDEQERLQSAIFDIVNSWILFSIINLIYFSLRDPNKGKEILILLLVLIFNILLLFFYSNAVFLLFSYNIVSIIGYLYYIIKHISKQHIIFFLIQYLFIYLLVFLVYFGIDETFWGIPYPPIEYIEASQRFEYFLFYSALAIISIGTFHFLFNQYQAKIKNNEVSNH